MPKFSRRLELFIASFIGLYFEMLIVRWLASEIRLFSYYKNLTMMAAFLGLGIGFALTKHRRDFMSFFIPFLLLYVPLVLIVSHQIGSGLVTPESSEYLWRPSGLPNTLSTIVFILIVVLFFLYTMFLFIPLGQRIGRLMVGLRPLTAYMINISGSLVGIWIFAAVSYLHLSPWMWYLVGLVVLLLLLRDSRRILTVSSISSIIIVVMVLITRRDALWSPYYRIDVSPLKFSASKTEDIYDSGYDIMVNKIGHMTAVNLSPEYLSQHPKYSESVQAWASIYNLPYNLIQPDRVLVVGAGTGNDVAAALRFGSEQVDAVEIDPLILNIAQKMHPENPYSSSKVNVYVDDARAFFEKTNQKYDLIVFGILDSQTMLSGMSSVRLDNFVYTVESLRQARDLLNEKGVIAITFFAERWWIKERIANILDEVFNEPPIQVNISGTPWFMYISGSEITPDEMEILCTEMNCNLALTSNREPIPLAIDDWPYLYLKDRGIPLPYWIVLVIVVITAWISTRKIYPSIHRMDWHFFFLGGAFLLIEFKIITELALLFGSTWIVNAIAVSAILVMVLLANLLISRLNQVKVNILYVLLFLSLCLGFFIPIKIFLPFGISVRVIMTSIFMGLPLFFASAIFAASLKQSKNVPLVFASNFFGSAVGGVLEYASLAFGISSLFIIGAGLYFVSLLTRSRN